MGRTEIAAAGRRRTVLHVTECSGGGVARALILAVKATADLEHVILAPHGAIDTSGVGARHIPLPEGARARISAVRRAAREVGASVVHAHSSLGGLYARLAVTTAPVLYQPHCYAFADVTKPRSIRVAYWLAERIMAHRTTAVLALTAHEERQARRLGVRTIHGIVNPPTITRQAGESRRSLGASVWTVVMAGRIAPQKAPDFFATVARKFDDDPTVRFVWIGDVSPDEKMCSGRAALAAAGVEIAGWVGDRELAERLADADVYLHTAAYEGFPLSLLDACELGVPSLVRNIPSLANCGLPTFTTPDEAAAEIRQLISDPAALSSLRDRSYALSAARGLDAHNASVRKAYASHVHPRKKSSRTG